MLSVVNYQMCFVCSSTQGGKRKAEGSEPNGRNAEDVATLRELKKASVITKKYPLQSYQVEGYEKLQDLHFRVSFLRIIIISSSLLSWGVLLHVH